MTGLTCTGQRSRESVWKLIFFYLPSNEQNLAYRAAALLFDEFGIEEGLSIRLRSLSLYQRGWQEEVLMLHPCFTA